jgi:hypothetical protein
MARLITSKDVEAVPRNMLSPRVVRFQRSIGHGENATYRWRLHIGKPHEERLERANESAEVMGRGPTSYS